MSDGLSEAEFELNRARERVTVLETAIRKHRDQRGDDRCWLDDQELYGVLPEGAPPDAALALPDQVKFLANCARYWACRQAHDTAPADGPVGRWATAAEVQLIELDREAKRTAR